MSTIDKPNRTFIPMGMRVDLSKCCQHTRPLSWYWAMLLSRNGIDDVILKELTKSWVAVNCSIPQHLTLEAYTIEVLAKLGIKDLTWDNFIVGLNIIGVQRFDFHFD